MREYIISVIAAAALGSVVMGICPEGEGKKLKKAVSLILSLLLVLCVASPLLSIIKGNEKVGDEVFNELDENSDDRYSMIWQDALQRITEDSVQGILEELLSENFGLVKNDYTLRAEISEGKPKQIEITLKGKGLLKNPRSIERYLKERLDFDISVR